MDSQGDQRPKLRPPPFLFDESEGVKEPISTLDLKYVGEYSGLTIHEVEELGVLEFYLLMHDAIVWNLSQTEDGQKRLERSQRFRQTEPDVSGFPGR